MASRKSGLLVALVLAGQSAAFAIPDLSHLFRRAPFEVARYASLGESFASGPSAGDVYDKVTKCRRYKQAQGPQVAADGRIQGPKPITFDFIACSGSKLKNIYEDSTGGGDGPGDKPKISQAGALKDKNPDLVTMSIGGNDVGFVDLLDRCVYRFKDLSGCRGCGPFPRLTHNDCTDDCNEAIKGVQDKIDGADFTRGLNDAMKAIFKSAPKTKLFITGYPRFWNTKTKECDNVSFKFGCINNSVLPLIKDRREKMNKLTDSLNNKIKNAIDNYATGAEIRFVDPNPFYEGHRFCEEGVSEPSYRNDKIYFYPFEYWTGGTLNVDARAAADCQAILDNGGDQGDYFACEMANEVKAGNVLDMSTQTNNVNGEVAITSSDGLPDFLARIFHPTIKGMTAYRDAIVSAYESYEAAAGPTPSPKPTPTPQPPPPPPPPAFESGNCCFHLNQYDDCNSEDKDLTCEVTLLDNGKKEIGKADRSSCNDKSPLVMKSKLPNDLRVTGEHRGDYIQFNYGSLAFTSGDSRCSTGGWDPRQNLCGLVPVTRKRQMDCCFPC